MLYDISRPDGLVVKNYEHEFQYDSRLGFT